MQRRWIAGIVLVAAASGALYLATRGGDRPASATAPTTTASETPGRNAPRRPLIVRNQPVRRAPSGRRIVPLDLGKGDPSPQIKKWKEEGLPGTFREIVAPDDSNRAEEVLTYRMRRLRFELTDAASACYTGGDGEEQIIVSYDLQVVDGVLSVDNLQLLSSTISDKGLESCMLDAIRTLHVDASDIPDMRRPEKTVIDQHAMWAAEQHTR